jgi:nucleoside-diphosphate-sugar epimerase
MELVAGGGGFIGGHLVSFLLSQGLKVKSVDIKPIEQWYQVHSGAVNLTRDLKDKKSCDEVTEGVSRVWNLAADMGGMGFITNNKAACMMSVLINTHLLDAAKNSGVEHFFFSSSACVYPDYRQEKPDIVPLAESDAYPAQPEDGYGWEKLFSERMCRHYFEDFGLKTYIGRFHNVYGPFGTYDGGREKAPAAICRKVAKAKLTGSADIEIWGDGEQTRSFMYIDDCIRGSNDLMNSSFHDPLNIGSAEVVTINQLVTIVENIADIKLNRQYDLSAPQGVRGRSSDNTLFKSLFGWEPSTSLNDGIEATYKWIYDQIASSI